MDTEISDTVKYIGVSSHKFDLFESQYLIPNGMAYNSYVILDEKIAVMDTCEKELKDEWFANLEKVLNGKTPDYLIVNHLEPDHSGNITAFCEKYPNVKIITSLRASLMIGQFCDINLDNIIAVNEDDTICLGQHTLKFIMAQMVHWPEVMVTYEESEKILFSADAFGKFGALDTNEEWIDEARRYYFNICGKYGFCVQTLLTKVAALDIKTICPLHGPILKKNIGYYLDLYNKWSLYEPENKGVFIAYATIHGNTRIAAAQLKNMLEVNGMEVKISDLSRCEIAEAVANAFKYEKIVLMASSYDQGVFAPMRDFLMHLDTKGFQKRKVAIVENYSWAASAARTIKECLSKMKDIKLIEPTVSIKSRVKAEDMKNLKILADNITAE